jgi:hypothetical protein
VLLSLCALACHSNLSVITLCQSLPASSAGTRDRVTPPFVHIMLLAKSAKCRGCGGRPREPPQGTGPFDRKDGLSIPGPAEQVYRGWMGHPLDRPKLFRPNLRNLWSLHQQKGVEKRPLMVKLHRHSSQLAVCSSRSDGGSGVTGQHRASGGTSCTNEPSSSIADCGFRIADWGQPCGGTPFAGRRARSRLYKQTQFPAEARWDGARGAGRRGVNAQNKPNLPGGGVGCCTNKANCPKRGTEAVSAGPKRRASAWQERVYGE